eukprot:tig00001067_g6762.t1
MPVEEAAPPAEAGPSGAAETPHYTLPNVASILPEYVNAEQDCIRQVFSVGNFAHFSLLPAEIRPNFVNRTRASMQEINRTSFQGYQVATKPFVPSKGGKYPLFQEFEYRPSEYTLADELAKAERIESDQKRIHSQDFIPADSRVKQKQDDAFHVDNSRFPFPYLGLHGTNPYEAADDDAQRQAWLQKMLAEQAQPGHKFVPSGARPDWDKPSRLLLPEILRSLHALLVADWPDHTFVVESDGNELIAVRFAAAGLESAKGLTTYMNIMAKCNSEVVTKYGLTRLVDKWGVQAEGFLTFTFKPPWVHLRASDAYFALNPQERLFLGSGSQGAASLAGASSKRSLGEEPEPIPEEGPEAAPGGPGPAGPAPEPAPPPGPTPH